MQTMYPGIVNSPKAMTASAISASATTITIDNGDYLPDAPNLAVLGIGNDAETILYAVKTGNVLSGITRGFQGAARVWPENTIIARNNTEYDYGAIVANIDEVSAAAQTAQETADDKAPTLHAAQHATGGVDAVTPESILAADRTHAAQHATDGTDAVTPPDIGAACASDLTAHVNDKGNPHDVTREQIGAAAPSTALTLTLTNTWAGSAAPFTQSINAEGVTDISNIVYDIASTATAEQLEAFEAARMICTPEVGVLAFKAFGDKPGVDIPIACIFVR